MDIQNQFNTLWCCFPQYREYLRGEKKKLKGKKNGLFLIHLNLVKLLMCHISGLLLLSLLGLQKTGKAAEKTWGVGSCGQTCSHSMASASPTSAALLRGAAGGELLPPPNHHTQEPNNGPERLSLESVRREKVG